MGNWPGAVRAYSMMNPVIKSAIMNAQRRYARRLVSAVKKHIMAQDLPWAPASTGKRGSHLMIDTRDYYESISYWQKDYQLEVGVKKHFIHGKTGQPLWKVAQWQEKGTKNIPARPLWKPTIEELGGSNQCYVEVKTEMFAKLAALGTGVWGVFK